MNDDIFGDFLKNFSSGDKAENILGLEYMEEYKLFLEFVDEHLSEDLITTATLSTIGILTDPDQINRILLTTIKLSMWYGLESYERFQEYLKNH